MMPGINPKQMKAAMKKMGMKMEEIEDVQKVVVKWRSPSRMWNWSPPRLLCPRKLPVLLLRSVTETLPRQF